MKGIFVTGTDTNVGKTVVCAALLCRYPGAGYWKPVQTGIEQDNDTAEIQRLSQASVHDEGIRLRNPVSPHLAAQQAGIRITVNQLPFPPTGRPWVVEGAGGVLVPLNEVDLMVDLMVHLRLPVVLVARTALGTINHTLLSLWVLRERGLEVLGVVLNGETNGDTRRAIAHYGRVDILGEMPRFVGLNPATIEKWAAAELDPNGRLREHLQCD